MSSTDGPQIGMIAWHDLTVERADEVRDFYRRVAGWEVREVDMGGYSDYAMFARATGATAAGICHARGVNAAVPPQWLLYIVVADVAASAAACVALGGAVVDGPRAVGDAQFCVIRDPAGAVCALYQPGTPLDAPSA